MFQSARLRRSAVGSPRLPPVKHKKKKRCYVCAKKTGIATSYSCRSDDRSLPKPTESAFMFCGRASGDFCYIQTKVSGQPRRHSLTCSVAQRTRCRMKSASRSARTLSCACAFLGRVLNARVALFRRCGNNYCATHRYAEAHGCTFDYKSEGRKILEQSNPVVTAPKLPKI